MITQEPDAFAPGPCFSLLSQRHIQQHHDGEAQDHTHGTQAEIALAGGPAFGNQLVDRHQHHSPRRKREGPGQDRSRGAAFLNLPAETSQLMDSLWLKVKTSCGNKTLIIGIVGLVVVIAVCAFFIIRRNKKKAKRKSLYSK